MLRSEINNKYKWNLNDIISSEVEWENIYTELKDNIEQIGKYAGKLDNKTDILECLDMNSKTS